MIAQKVFEIYSYFTCSNPCYSTKKGGEPPFNYLYFLMMSVLVFLYSAAAGYILGNGRIASIKYRTCTSRYNI